MTLPASGPISLYQIADEFSLAHTTAFPSGFYGKGGALSSGPLSFADFYGRSAASLSATVSPTTLNKGTATGTGTTVAATCTASAGTGPYSYAWSKVSGDSISIDSASSQATTFTAGGLATGETRTAVFRCVVTDATSATATSNTVSVTIFSTS